MSLAEIERDICYIRDQLENYIKQDAEESSIPLQYLSKLRRLPITLELLQKTRIGMTVNQYRKATKHDAISNQAKELIKGWKKFVPDASAAAGGTNVPLSNVKKEKKDRFQAEQSEDSNHGSVASSSASNGEKKKHRRSEKHKFGDTENGEADGNEDREPDTKRPKAPTRETGSSASKADSGLGPSFVGHTDDPGRLKCRDMIARALLSGDGPAPPPERTMAAENCAQQIEDAVFKEYGSNTSQRYRMRIISRVQNLKDVKNPQLREAVLAGLVSADKFAVMTSEEMASPELKQLRRDYESESINGARMAFTGGTKSTLLKCKRCNKTSVTYNQVQTRSSDEPMTTFCFCNECGFRWKFC